MSIKRFIFNMLLKISRSKLRRGISVFNVRSDYNIFAKVIYFLSPIEKNVLIEFKHLSDVNCLRACPPVDTKKQILFFHGGAFVLGLDDLQKAYIPFAAKLASITKADVWVPDYRTAPENAFPDIGIDCMTTYMTLLKEGHAPQDIILMGDSCGAALALSMVMKLRDEGKPLPSCIATISAWTDLALTGQSLYTRSDIDPMFNNDPLSGFANHYLQGNDPQDPMASPLYGEFHDFPPMYLLCGGREILHDDTTRIAKKAKAAGVDVTLDIKEDMIHIYPVFFGIIPEGVAAMERITGFIEKVSSEKKPETTKKKKVARGKS